MSFDFQHWYSQETSKGTVYAYRGEISAVVVSLILDNVENELNKISEAIKIRRKLYNILVEILQNLYHHVGEVPLEMQEEFGTKYIAFILKKTEENFRISTLNFIPNNIVKPLKDRIEQINSLNKEELKALYKIILNNQEFSAKGGGGLGLIDITRRSGTKIEAQFIPITNTHSFYILEMNV